MQETQAEKKQREALLGKMPKMEERREDISKQFPGAKYRKTFVQEYDEEERQARLNQARLLLSRERLKISSIANDVAEKLEKMIEKGNDKSAFFIVLIIGLAKDGLLDIALDFLGVGLIPIIGQIPGFFLTSVLFYLMWGRGMLKGRIFAWVLSMFIGDSLPIIEELPLTTIAILFAWKGLLKRIKKIKEEREKLANMTDDEIKEVERRFEL
ncbi:hypothetical protein C4572_00320 [Candidatus Parcubacteria bacterium]|nr:MAG: hypothetical protein C4572_00320 [Candidatus Parcubacteria bacterium]